MLLHALYERLCTAPLNRLPFYGALEVIVALLLLLWVLTPDVLLRRWLQLRFHFDSTAV